MWQLVKQSDNTKYETDHGSQKYQLAYIKPPSTTKTHRDNIFEDFVRTSSTQQGHICQHFCTVWWTDAHWAHWAIVHGTSAVWWKTEKFLPTNTVFQLLGFVFGSVYLWQFFITCLETRCYGMNASPFSAKVNAVTNRTDNRNPETWDVHRPNYISISQIW